MIESPQYADLTLVDVKVEYTDPVPLRQPERILVTVAYPAGTEPPPVVGAIQALDSVAADSAFHLPTGPLVESRTPDVVVDYTARDR